MDILAMPDIPTLSISMAQSNVMNQLGTELLASQLDQMEASTAELTKAMENSVQPYLGGNIDISL